MTPAGRILTDGRLRMIALAPMGDGAFNASVYPCQSVIVFVIGTALGGYTLTAAVGTAIAICGAAGLLVADRRRSLPVPA